MLTLDDPRLFTYPWIYFVEPGQPQADRQRGGKTLREFLLRGGTAMFDDFHGPFEWDNFARADEAGVSRSRDRRLPQDHPVFSCFYKLDGYPQVAGLGSFLAGRTWEKGGFVAHLRTILDDNEPADDVHQLEHRHGRRLGMVERRGLSRLHQVHVAWPIAWASTRSSMRSPISRT